MRLRLVTVAILLALASGAHGRPKHPDPLDNGGRQQEANVDSRYTLTSSPTSSRRRDISITNLKFDRSKWSRGRSSSSYSSYSPSALPRLSLDGNAKKNYLPVGALSSAGVSRSNRRSSPMIIPFLPSTQYSTPTPIPVSIATQESRVVFSKTIPRERVQSRSFSLPLPIPIPVTIPEPNQTPRAERRIASRNLVKIIPQRLKPNNYVRRNLTAKPPVDFHLKNWPNEVVQNVEDLFNYEKYTSFYDDKKDDDNKISTEIVRLPNHREPAIKSPGSTQVLWSKLPVVEATSTTTEDVKIHSSTNFDNLLGELGKNKVKPQKLTSSQVSQNTIVHIMNAGSRKPNVTVVEPVVTPNKTKTASTRPPQNVHIMFMSDKDSNQTSGKPMKPVEITGGSSDCPTIMINSITQINNTIESKEGCTDLNIVINSHVLNTHILKPGSSGQNVPLGSTPDSVKDPYGQASDTPSNLYQTYPPVSTYNPNPPNTDDPSNPNANYNPTNNYNTPSYGDASDKDPGNQPLSDTGASEFSEPDSQVSTFEVFQNTHINVGGSGFQADVPNNVDDDSGSASLDDSAGTDAEGSPLTDPTDETLDITGAQGPEETAADAPGEVASDGTQGLSETSAVAGDVGSPQANDAPGAISLPSLPNIPNLPNPGQLSNVASNLGGGTGGGGSSGGSSGGSIADDDDDDFDLLEAISPYNLLDSISSVFDSFSGLNPVNYGILGMAVAPFVAFAAGIMGVAAFIFPWAFPGTTDLARSWNQPDAHVRIRVSPTIRDVVHSSIHEYKHLNEWKGRRRRRKRKR